MSVPAVTRGGYGRVLALLVVLPTASVLVSGRAGVLGISLLAVTVWIALATATGLGRSVTWSGVALVALLAVAAGVAVAIDDDRLLAGVEIANAVAIAAILVVLARALKRERDVTFSTVAGVLCAYLLIGLFFASAYQGALLLADGAFVTQGPAPDRFELVYFSFVTLTTVGFGDITPGVDATRALAMTEAVLGQLFLVTVVARVVATASRGRRPRSDEDAEG